MTGFSFRGENVSISDEYGNIAVLNPLEALNLLQWLNEKRDTLLITAQQAINEGQTTEQEIEIHLYQENLSHLEKLREAMPSLHEYQPPAKVLSIPLEEVTARAIKLLKELQVEYWIHPMLEDTDVFAQA